MKPLVILTCIAALFGSLALSGCAGERTRRRPRPRGDAASVVSDRLNAPGASMPDRGLEPLSSQPAEEPADAPAPGKRVAQPKTAEEIFEDLKEDQKVKILEARHEAQLGDAAFEQGDYKTAVRHYERARSLSPVLDDRTRERLNQAKVVLNERSGDVPSIAKDILDTKRVEEQARLEEAERGLKEAEELVASGDFELAEKKLAKIYEELTTYEYPVDVSKVAQRTKQLLAQVSRKKMDQEKSTRAEQESKAKSSADQVVLDQEKAKQQQVRELTRKAAEYIRFKEYDKAIDACERILKLDPQHRVAKFWLRDSRQQILDERKARVIKLELEQNEISDETLEETAILWDDPFVFPKEKKWDQVKKRKEQLEVISTDDPEPIRKIKNLLESAQVSFDFEDKPITDAVAFLRQITGINITIDEKEVDVQNTKVSLHIQNLKASNALNLILLQTGLAYTFVEQVLTITKPEKARGEAQFRIYPVADILNRIRDFQAPEIKLESGDEASRTGGGGGAGVSIATTSIEEDTKLSDTDLIQLIQDSTGGDERWGADGGSKIEYHQGLLFVTAPVELQKEVYTVLENLRQDSDLFVMIEARFIDITDDFLQDIGIDSRALGAVNNLGTPFANIINDSRTGGNDLGFVKQGNPTKDVTLVMGQDRWAGRISHIIDGFTGLVQGDRLRGGPGGVGGLTLQSTWLDPFQLNAILRAVQEKSDVRQLTAPAVTAHNGQRVYVSVITQRAYISDYELVSGGTGFAIIEVADPVVSTFQEGVILDVDPVISADRKYITLDVRPTMATLIGGVISTIIISLGSFTNVANNVPIGVPEVTLQQAFTSVTVPNGGTVLLGGFKSLNEQKYVSYIPILGQIPIVKNLFRRKAEVSEKRSLVILVSARIINPRAEEENRFNQ
ncbi:MAG: secretin and TonB N-terminal domain-containing protein [Planctomycetes bacterium]|nr:secretin and TonB N-terminal domain-containing protein [Planctomycetota bacterium]